MFSWDESGALLRYWDEERKQYMKVVCQVINGLPYITWTDFKPIRILLSRRYKGKDTTAASAKEAPADVTSQQKRMCATCTPDEFAEPDLGRRRRDRQTSHNRSLTMLSVLRPRRRRCYLVSKSPAKMFGAWFGMLVLRGQRTRTSLQAEGGHKA